MEDTSAINMGIYGDDIDHCWVIWGYDGIRHPAALENSVLFVSDWWFGTMEFYDFPYELARIIPTDFQSMIFQRGRSTTNQSLVLTIINQITTIVLTIIIWPSFSTTNQVEMMFPANCTSIARPRRFHPRLSELDFGTSGHRGWGKPTPLSVGCWSKPFKDGVSCFFVFQSLSDLSDWSLELV